MTSTFTWLDYSEHDRQKMLDVIQIFGERTTRDELGLGGIRDAFADYLFPGTSTIQTRAKYFLFIPWIYLELEQRRVPSDNAAIRSRKREVDLINALLASDNPIGTIGRLAKENIQRLPSSVYWQGLGVWGIRTFEGSQDEYHRSLDLFYVRRHARTSSLQEFAGEAPDSTAVANWHSGLPPMPKGFPEKASFELSRDEAAYLREQVLRTCPESLLAFLLRGRQIDEEANLAWEMSTELPDNLSVWIGHGRNFSEMLHGAALLYNLMLAEASGWSDKIADYRARLSDWWNALSQRRLELRDWDLQVFWNLVTRQNPRISTRTKNFVKEWISLVQSANGERSVVELSRARELIHHRERYLKGRMARLTNDRARELWQNSNGEAGSQQVDLRWNAAKRIAADIADAWK